MHESLIFWNEPVRTFPIISPLLFRELWKEKKTWNSKGKAQAIENHFKTIRFSFPNLFRKFLKEAKGIFMIILFQRTINGIKSATQSAWYKKRPVKKATFSLIFVGKFVILFFFQIFGHFLDRCRFFYGMSLFLLGRFFYWCVRFFYGLQKLFLSIRILCTHTLSPPNYGWSRFFLRLPT